MPSESASNERRLHPASLLFRVIGHARGFLLPAIAVFFFSRGETWQVWAAVLFVPIVALDVFRYLTLRWRYDADELVVREGWIFRSERHVPYARIQNVDLKQNVLHRALSVAEVKIETAGGADAEVSLSVVGLAAYEELRERAFAGRAAARAKIAAAAGSALRDDATTVGDAGAPRADDGARIAFATERAARPVETLVALSPFDILLLGANPGRGLAIVAIGWGLAREFGFFEGWEERAERAAQSAESTQFLFEMGSLLLVVAGVAALFLLSLGASLVEFHGYRLESDGDVFRVRRGLLTRQVQTIPRGRIQVASVERPWFLALLGRARVQVRTAGGISGGDGDRGGGRHFAPIVRAERVPELLARIRPELDVTNATWRPLGRTAPRRFVIGSLIPTLVFAGLAITFFEWIGVGVAVALLAFAVVVALRRAKHAAWAREPWGLAVREGAFSTVVHATFADKVQAVELHENPFDRRHRHATVSFDTAGALLRAGPEVAIRYLPRVEAEALREDLVGAAARSRFRW